MSPFFFDRSNLAALAAQHHDEYENSRPFRHVVIDDFLPENVADEALEAFPRPGDISWVHLNHGGSRKLATPSDDQLAPPLRLLLREFNAKAFTDFLEALTKIDHLIVDQHFEGGGLHQMERGGFLKVHKDFNQNQRLQAERRLNAILYFNKDWSPGWGGELQLWDSGMTEVVGSVEPIFNRLVVFDTSDALHGLPDPLTFPVGETRKSIAAYYYTAQPLDARQRHSTLYHERPGEKLRQPALVRAKRLVSGRRHRHAPGVMEV